MKVRQPLYYKQFKCTMSKCKDNCCRASWDIEVDEDAIDYYKSSIYEDKLMDSIEDTESKEQEKEESVNDNIKDIDIPIVNNSSESQDQNTEEVNNESKYRFIKNTNNPVKAILVTKEQEEKLSQSLEKQEYIQVVKENLKDLKPFDSNDLEQIRNQDMIEKAFSVMESERAKATFLKLLEFRMLTDRVDIPTSPEKGMYFEYDFFQRKDDEVFIDCGACGGSSLSEFLEINHHCFKAYYGIEPDPTNFDKLEKFISCLSESDRGKMKIYNAAAYAHNKGTNFFILNGPGSFQAENGTDKVKTIKIDDILNKEAATYIKMNIEGSEVSALRGAEYTIRNYYPRMAIMGYHKTSDLWKVPLLIKEYYGDYHLELRSYMRNVAFTYYAF